MPAGTVIGARQPHAHGHRDRSVGFFLGTTLSLPIKFETQWSNAPHTSPLRVSEEVTALKNGHGILP